MPFLHMLNRIAPTSALLTLGAHSVRLKREPLPQRNEESKPLVTDHLPAPARTVKMRVRKTGQALGPGEQAGGRMRQRLKGVSRCIILNRLAGDENGGVSPATQESALTNVWDCGRLGVAAASGPGSCSVVPAARSEAFLQQQQ